MWLYHSLPHVPWPAKLAILPYLCTLHGKHVMLLALVILTLLHPFCSFP